MKKTMIILVASYLLFSCTRKNEDVHMATNDTETQEHVVNPVRNDVGAVTQQELFGTIGMSAQWKSAWIDFDKPMNFRRGDRLRISLGGNASKVIVRLLSVREDANSPAGVVGRPMSVDLNGEVVVELHNDYTGIKQISVHGGENPWGVYPMQPGNGAPVIQHVYLNR